MTKFEHARLINIGVDTRLIKVLVKDTELVLVESKGIDEPNVFIKTKYYKLILISRTEKIEVGDWVYNSKDKTISKSNFNLEYYEDFEVMKYLHKILALPQNFSPQQLQMIVDGKLKDGDKVLIECVRDVEFMAYDETIIKLNPHITIYPVERDLKFYENNAQDDFASTPISVLRYISELEQKLKSNPVEEKMYTREEVRNIIELHLDHIESSSLLTTDQWFEQKVK